MRTMREMDFLEGRLDLDTVHEFVAQSYNILAKWYYIVYLEKFLRMK